jgi:adenylate cyclase
MSHPTLLIVDDDEILIQNLGRALRKDYRTLLAGDAAEGLAILEQEKVDLILSDYHMPGMTGLEFLSQVATVRPDVIRILFSAEPDMQMAIRAVNQGDVFRILVKPCDLAELRVVLHLGVEKLRLERENRVLRTLLSSHPDLEQEFDRQMATRWPAFAARVPPHPPLAGGSPGAAGAP